MRRRWRLLVGCWIPEALPVLDLDLVRSHVGATAVHLGVLGLRLFSLPRPVLRRLLRLVRRLLWFLLPQRLVPLSFLLLQRRLRVLVRVGACRNALA